MMYILESPYRTSHVYFRPVRFILFLFEAKYTVYVRVFKHKIAQNQYLHISMGLCANGEGRTIIFNQSINVKPLNIIIHTHG